MRGINDLAWMDSLSALDATFSFNFKEGALKPLVRDAHIKGNDVFVVLFMWCTDFFFSTVVV